MTLESPATYGEWYWKHGVDAQKEFDEQIEQSLAPFMAGVLGDIPELEFLPPGIRSLLGVLAKPVSPGLGGYAALSAGEFVSETIRDLTRPAMAMMQRKINRGALETWLTSNEAVRLKQRNKMDDSYFDLIMSSEGYDPVIATGKYDSLMPYPSVAELMRFARYHGDPENTHAAVWEKFKVPELDYELHEWLSLSVLSTEQVHKLFRRGVITEADVNFFLSRLGWRGDDVDFVKELGYIIPNPMLATQGNLMQGLDDDRIIEDIIKADIHPDKAQNYLDAILTKPATQEIVAYELRRDPNLDQLPDRLRRIGIHPDFVEVYKELANVIPPVADIITMAVREVFTPAIAARFGQYEDFPADLEEWGLKKGLSREWSQRYWAAHWSLPSATQGFQMLHRGVIEQDELNMLLRAQDVMPYWRQKLTQIAFRPLTRVDVRRMYREGVLDESEVYEAYLDHGYAEDNAKRMTEFTVKQTLSSQAKFTSRDVIAAFTKRMISSSEARSLLSDLGIASENISYILSRAEYKRKWDLTDSRIAGIRNLYKKGVYDENKARSELGRLNLPSDEMEVLFEQWWFEKVGELAPTWTKAETLKFAKAGIITVGRARTELERMGYDNEHVDIYVSQIA